jgi:fructokinase
MIDIVCLGELLVDMTPAETGRRLAEVSSFIPKPGGAPANVAVGAARLGLQSAFIGKVGEDAFGHHLAQVLARHGVDTRGVRFDRQYRTTLAFVALPEANAPEFIFYRSPGADVMLRPDEIDCDLTRSARAFHFGSLSLTQEPCRSAALEGARIAREAGALISFDANFRPDLWPDAGEARARILACLCQVDVLKVNEVELGLLTGKSDLKSARELLELGPRACVATFGAHGSYFQTRAASGLVPGFPVAAVDATGCGDGFVAGLLMQLLDSSGWEESISAARMTAALRYANAVGAMTAMKPGAIPALPTGDAVREFLRNHDG